VKVNLILTFCQSCTGVSDLNVWCICGVLCGDSV